ncbi:unnamed protein product, partial [Ranitomeya imitator]
PTLENTDISWTFIFAIKDINNNPSILPNITLGYHLYDSCGNVNKVLKDVLQILSGHSVTAPNYSCMDHDNVAGYIGDQGSATTLPMAQLLGMYGYTQHGSDRQSYKIILHFIQYRDTSPFGLCYGGRTPRYASMRTSLSSPMRGASAYPVPQVVDLTHAIWHFPRLDSLSSSVNSPEHLLEMLQVFLPGGNEDGNVIQVRHCILLQSLKQEVDHPLESGRGILHAKGHDRGLVQSKVCDKGGLLLRLGAQGNLPVSLTQIHYG